MNVVLVPAYRRPEFLWHCIQNIKLARGADQMHYIFRFDYGFDPDNQRVIKDFPFSHEIAATNKVPYQLAKQSYSLLTGYQIAASQTDGLVFMIEEDVMIARDFFEWHLLVQDLIPDNFCSIAVANPNRTMVDTGRPEEFYLATGDYCSLGVCFRRQTLMEHVFPAVNTRYYLNPVDYCARNFPGSPIGHAFAEQDGLIRRIQIQLGHVAQTVWPWTPRAYHAGYYGKNRGAGPRGLLAQRIANLTDIIYSDEAMRTFAKHPEWYADSRPINLNPVTWTEQNLKSLDPTRNPLRF